MILVGIDDTDTLRTPGTVHLARHLMRQLPADMDGAMITRHQLLQDPRVPCTRKNGCVAIRFASRRNVPIEVLADSLARRMLEWCPEGSDPGLCIAEEPAPKEVVEFGRLCQTTLVTQQDARELAEKHSLVLRGVGGTEDGIIGALAAVGLINTGDDGRVVFLGRAVVDHYNVSGTCSASWIRRLGVDDIRHVHSGQSVLTGQVDVGKRLRPNLRNGQVVLFVSPSAKLGVDWHAERVT